MDFKDHYAALDLQPDCEDQEIKKSYRRLVRQYHPDTHGNSEESIKRFHQIQDAYDTLSDPEKKEDYDRRYHIIFRRAETYGPDGRKAQTVGSDNQERSQKSNFQSQSLNAERLSALHRRLREEMSRSAAQSSATPAEEEPKSSKGQKSFVGKIKDSLSFRRSESSGNRKSPNDSQNTKRAEPIRTYQFTINALESIQDTTRELALQGQSTPRIIRVKIPAGINNGAVLKVHCPASGDFPPQSVEIKVRIEPHPIIERLDNRGLLVKVPITPLEAISGAEVDVPTMLGSERVPIPPGWSGEKLIRISGKGLLDSSTGSRGDIYVKTYVVLPQELDNRVRQQTAREAAEALEGLFIRSVRSGLPRTLSS